MRSLHAVSLAAVGLALLAGCGSGSEEDDQAAQRERFEDAQLKFAQCLREEGIDADTPSGGGLRIQSGPSENGRPPNQEKFRKAEEKCRPILEKAGGPPELSEEDREEFQDQALAFARCMRRQGIDFPDPEFGEGGRATQRVGGPGRAEPNEARMRAATKKCEEFQPKPPGGEDGPGGGGGPGERVGP